MADQEVLWGRRATDEAVATGKSPIIDDPRPTVPTSWLTRQLLIDDRQPQKPPKVAVAQAAIP
jgi:hypothetical protein